MGKLVLSEAPAHLKGPVKAWAEPVVIPTYMPLAPDKNPMFLDKRVYQGSSGKVYPLPVIDRISEEKADRKWEAVHIENEYVRLMILPEIGGRIHVGLDKTNGYDFFYRQNVIKPALVGLAGPWISGGVEFNWPQHHRPSTFMRTDWAIEEHGDGSVTVWCSEHEPMNRMKGMHGVCLRPGSSLIELKVRIYNRTEFMQTFLWWANAAVRVHEKYQAFFPPDVQFVADHAKRAMSRFPLCEGKYYGVDYARRAREGVPPQERPKRFVPPEGMYAANDLRWYANIPVPTSYMAIGSKEDFFGGYDHAAEAGVVHVADHHIAPGKKLWTWGNHEFGYAWDRNLTDEDGPYAELMAGVFTDNQPDFSWLMPGETRAWSQYWYPIQKIGPVQKANTEAALSMRLQNGQARLGVAVTSAMKGAIVTLERAGRQQVADLSLPAWIAAHKWTEDLHPGKPFVGEVDLGEEAKMGGWRLRVEQPVPFTDGKRDVICFHPTMVNRVEIPEVAKEPPLPPDVQSVEELYFIGTHLEQYRHATRMPADYWREALKREPGDNRCNTALGWWHLRRGEFGHAVQYFETALKAWTLYNPNPRDGEAYYGLGIALRYLKREEAAYDALSKATWNAPWQSPAHFALAQLDCAANRWNQAHDHLSRVLEVNRGHLQARCLMVLVMRRIGKEIEAQSLLEENRKFDPLDFSAILLLGRLAGRPFDCNVLTASDLAFDFARAGCNRQALEALNAKLPDEKEDLEQARASPILFYQHASLPSHFTDAMLGPAAGASPDHYFPSRLEEIGILLDSIERNANDSRAPYYLGNLLYSRGRREEAIGWWEKAAKADRAFSIPWRNLGIGYYNVFKDAAAAKGAYQRALQANPNDARLLYERDQLWKRTREVPERRLDELVDRVELVEQRDDLTIEFCTLLNQTGQHAEALEVLQSRRFQPWEGGEGLVLGQWERTHVALGRKALWQGRAAEARTLFEAALAPPVNLGEAKHLLANSSELHYWAGMACKAAGDLAAAQRHWQIAAESIGDFQRMAACAYSELSFFAAMALRALDRQDDAAKVFAGMLSFAQELARKPAKIDYFATSLPTMLLFDEDLQERQRIQALVIEALARFGLGEKKAARTLLGDVLRDDPNHALAADLMESLDWDA